MAIRSEASMSRILPKLVGAVATFASIGILSGGCVEAEGRIFIETIYPPEEGVCQPDPTVITDRGVVVCDDEGCPLFCLDEEDGGGCFGGICALVRNQMTSSLDNPSNNNNVETSIVMLHSYDLRYIADGIDLSAADTTVQITVAAQPN
jgi:hypothetical protein